MNTESHSDRYRGLDGWPTGQILSALWESQMAAVASVRPALPDLDAAVEAAASRLADPVARWAVAGAGTSVRLAVLDAVELPPTFGFDAGRIVPLVAGGVAALTRSIEGAEDDEPAGSRSVAEAGLGPRDILIAAAASGRTPFTVAAARAARAAGTLTIGLAGNPNTPLLAAVDHPILLATGGEPIAGSTRLGAGTAQKVTLNLLSTAIMVRLGHVHDGIMVDVRPANAKLRLRAVGMVAAVAGCGEAAARAALERTGYAVKEAILVAGGATPGEAEAALRQAGGHLRGALAAGSGSG